MKTISRYIMTLALLLTAVTGAWATDVYVVGNGNGNWLNGVAWDPGSAGNKMTEQNGVYSITFTNVAANPESPFQFKFSIDGTWDVNYGCISDTENELNKTLSNIDTSGGNNILFGLTESADVTISFNLSEMTYMISTKGMKVGDDAASGPEVAWDKAKKTGTFTMPAFDVVLTPIYAKAAAFATTGAEPEAKTLLPEAAEGVIAGTDASLIAEGTGIVAFAAASAEVKQGTLMYAIGNSATEAPALTAFSATVPTAEDIADAGDVYVWYYIKGADTPDGQQATEENTFNDTEICTTPLTVQVLTNKFDIQFNAANANTIEAGKATVTVGGTAATVTEGKLEGVKMGSEVKVKANTGYKFRKVEVKKGAEAPAILLDNTMTAWTAGKYAVPAGGLTYSAAITVSGDVTLTLTDGETLTLNKGISLASGATLTVQGNGTMNVNGTNESTASTVAGSGTLVLTSGTLNAKGGNGQSLTLTQSSSIWDGNTGASGGVAINGNVTVSGGTVTATGGNGGNLNTVALGFSENNHGGNGGAAISGTVTVNAGGWTATNGSNGTYTAGDDTNCSAGTGGKAVAGTVTDNR